MSDLIIEAFGVKINALSGWIFKLKLVRFIIFLYFQKERKKLCYLEDN